MKRKILLTLWVLLGTVVADTRAVSAGYPDGLTISRGNLWEFPCPPDWTPQSLYVLSVTGADFQFLSSSAMRARKYGNVCTLSGGQQLDSRRLFKSYLPMGQFNWSVIEASGKSALHKGSMTVVPWAANNFVTDIVPYRASLEDGFVPGPNGLQITKNIEAFILSHIADVTYKNQDRAQLQRGVDYTGLLDVQCPFKTCEVGIVFQAAQLPECTTGNCSPSEWFEIRMVDNRDLRILQQRSGPGGVQTLLDLPLPNTAGPINARTRFRLVMSDGILRFLATEHPPVCVRILGQNFWPSYQVGIRWKSWDAHDRNKLIIDHLVAASPPEFSDCAYPLPRFH